MVEFVVFLTALIVLGLVVGLVGALVSSLVGLVLLPFHLISLVFRGLGALLALPFLLLFGFIGLLIFGAGVVALLLPALPLIALVWLAIWLFRRPNHRAGSTA